MPFVGGESNEGTYFVTWHQPGPAETTRYIGTGTGWDALVLAGLWGYCAVLHVPDPAGTVQRCLTPGSVRSGARVIVRSAPSPVTPRWIIGTARPDVANLKLSLAGGGSVRVRVAEVSGQRFYALRIGPAERVVSWGAYDAAGHRLYGGGGAPDAAG